MLSFKSIQRLYKSSRLHKFPTVKKLRSLKTRQNSSESTTNDTNLSRDQVLEIYDWISQLNSQSKAYE